MNATAATSIGASLQAFAAQAPAVARTLAPRPGVAARDAHPAPGMHLTPRQLEVLTLLCEGLPNKLICRELNIATGTVKVHMSCIMRELGVASRLQAVVAARRLGLVTEPNTGPAGNPDSGLSSLPVGSNRRLVPGAGYREAVTF